MDSPPPQPADRYRNWLDLPLDVTSSILRRLDVIEILTSAQLVCMHWRYICKDPSMWRTLNLGYLLDTWWDHFPYDVSKYCRRAVDLSCGQLVGIEVGSLCDGKFLKYITERSRELRYFQFGLHWTTSISDKVWSEAVANIPLLEELELSNCPWNSEKFLEAVGRSCPHLKSLKLINELLDDSVDTFKVCNVSAVAMAKNLPGLVSLSLYANALTDDGVQAILEGCPRLQSLELRQCRNVTLKGEFGRRCSERIKDLRFHYFDEKEYERKWEEYWSVKEHETRWELGDYYIN